MITSYLWAVDVGCLIFKYKMDRITLSLLEALLFLFKMEKNP